MLYLSSNRITDLGALYLANALQNNTVRHILYLSMIYLLVLYNIGAHDIESWR